MTATTISDEERREVARRLRELVPCLFDDGEYIDCWEVEEALGLVSDDGAWYKADGVMRLADLIEPSGHECVPGECPLNVRHDNDRIDRDALLALADEIERKADEALDESAHSISEAVATSKLNEYTVRNGIAQRIRKALGVCDG